ncbi:MAG: choice-of-anchor B family protein [Bacteroidota bacterium]|nr:choice-of-anchor B family protein [Bacteroidota bacterium]
MNKLLILSLILFFSLVSQNSFPQAGKNIRLLNNINPLDTSTLSWTYSALWGYKAPDGREYAMLGSHYGTYFIDITDSNNTRVVDFITGAQVYYKEMKTYSHYAYIVSDGVGVGVQIVDLQYLPDSIRHVGNFISGNLTSIHTISQEGPYLYLQGGSRKGIVVFDLSVNPEIPVVRGEWQNLYVHDSRIVNDTIWACNIFDGKVTVIDARNKDSLRTITQWPNISQSSPHNCALTQDRNYIYVTNELSNPGRLNIWDIKDLGNVTLMNIYIPPLFENCISHNVELYNNQLVAAYYEGGVKLFDVSNPIVLNEIGWYDTYTVDNGSLFNGCWGVYKFPSGKIIASDMQKGLFVLRYNPPVNQKPKADFMSAKTNIHNGDSLQFYDCASNNPGGYSWNITGPHTYATSLANPKIRFLNPGDYSVKLRVSNQYGSDSIEKINYIHVSNSVLNPFNFTGQLNQTIYTNPNDTSTVKFYWTRSSTAPDVRYNFSIKKLTGSIVYFIPSDNNGVDTVITLRKSYLDSLAILFGLTGDSIRTLSKVYARSVTDSIPTVNSLILNITTNSVGINQISSIVPEEYKLYNNYPNPFNPSTTIKFDIPEKAFVSLVLYDMLGREIRKLVNTELTPGYYEYNFSAGNLSSGIYYYRLVTKNMSEAKRMVLIK